MADVISSNQSKITPRFDLPQPLERSIIATGQGGHVMVGRIGIALITTAFLLPLQVMAQKGGRSSFDAPEKAAIKQLFERYSAAFSSKDYVKLREYLQVPFVRFGPSNTRVETAPADWAILPTMDEAINFYRAAQDALATQGVERFEWGQTRITALSVDRALVNKTYRRYRKDGTLLQEAASFYLVSKSSGSWKICGILNQDLREFGKVY